MPNIVQTGKQVKPSGSSNSDVKGATYSTSRETAKAQKAGKVAYGWQGQKADAARNVVDSTSSYTVSNGKKTYTLTADELNGVRNLYKTQWADNYGQDDEDQLNKRNGVMPRSFANSYKKGDKSLYDLGLPNSKYFEKYLETYRTAKKEQQQLEASYKAKQTRLNEFYTAVGNKWLDDEKEWGNYNPEQEFADLDELGNTTGTSTAWSNRRQQQFYDLLNSSEWADVRAMYDANRKTVKKPEGEYDTPRDYYEALYKAEYQNKDFTEEQQAKNIYNVSFTFDDFDTAYNDNLRPYFTKQRFVDETTGLSFTGEDALNFAGKAKIVGAAQSNLKGWVDSYEGDDYTSLIQDLADGGATRDFIAQAKDVILDSINSKEKAKGKTAKERKATKQAFLDYYDKLTAVGETPDRTRLSKKTGEALPDIHDWLEKETGVRLRDKKVERVYGGGVEHTITDHGRGSTVNPNNLTDIFKKMEEEGYTGDEIKAIHKEMRRSMAFGSQRMKLEAEYYQNWDGGINRYASNLANGFENEGKASSMSQQQVVDIISKLANSGQLSAETLQDEMSALRGANVSSAVIRSAVDQYLTGAARDVESDLYYRGDIAPYVNEGNIDALRAWGYTERSLTSTSGQNIRDALEQFVTDYENDEHGALIEESRAKFGDRFDSFEIDQAFSRVGWQDAIPVEQRAMDYFIAYDHGAEVMSGDDRQEAYRYYMLSDEDRNAESIAAWQAMTPEEQSAYIERFNLEKDFNPILNKSYSQQIRQQFVGAWAKTAFGLIKSAANLYDMTNQWFARSASARFIDDMGRERYETYVENRQNSIDALRKTHAALSMYGKAQGQDGFSDLISVGSDIFAEILRMNTMSFIGGGIANVVMKGAGMAGLTAQAVTSEKVARGLNRLAKVASSSAFVSDAIGNYWEEAIQEDCTTGQATVYALVCGVLEGAVEALNMDAITTGLLGGDKLADSLIRNGKLAMSKGFRAKCKLIGMVGSALGEGGEEGLSYIASTILGNYTIKRNQFDGTPKPFAGWSWSDLWNDVKMGALVGLFANAMSGSNEFSPEYIICEKMMDEGINPTYVQILHGSAVINSMSQAELNDYRAHISQGDLLSDEQLKEANKKVYDARQATKAAYDQFKSTVENRQADIKKAVTQEKKYATQKKNALAAGDVQKASKKGQLLSEATAKRIKLETEFKNNLPKWQAAYAGQVNPYYAQYEVAQDAIKRHWVAFDSAMATYKMGLSANKRASSVDLELADNYDRAMGIIEEMGGTVTFDQLNDMLASALGMADADDNVAPVVADSDVAVQQGEELAQAIREGGAEGAEAVTQAVADEQNAPSEQLVAEESAPVESVPTEQQTENQTETVATEQTAQPEAEQTAEATAEAEQPAPSRPGQFDENGNFIFGKTPEQMQKESLAEGRTELSEAERAEVEAFANKFGKSITFEAMPAGHNGYYNQNDGRIHLNIYQMGQGNASYLEVAKITFVHELTHSLEKTKSYALLQNLVKKAICQREGLSEEEFETKYVMAFKNAYENAGIPLTFSGAKREAIAHFIEENALAVDSNGASTVKAFADFVARENSGLAGHIFNNITYMLSRIGKGKNPGFKMLHNSQKIWARALKEAGVDMRDSAQYAQPQTSENTQAVSSEAEANTQPTQTAEEPATQPDVTENAETPATEQPAVEQPATEKPKTKLTKAEKKAQQEQRIDAWFETVKQSVKQPAVKQNNASRKSAVDAVYKNALKKQKDHPVLHGVISPDADGNYYLTDAYSMYRTSDRSKFDGIPDVSNGAERFKAERIFSNEITSSSVPQVKLPTVQELSDYIRIIKSFGKEANLKTYLDSLSESDKNALSDRFELMRDMAWGKQIKVPIFSQNGNPIGAVNAEYLLNALKFFGDSSPVWGQMIDGVKPLYLSTSASTDAALVTPIRVYGSVKNPMQDLVDVWNKLGASQNPAIDFGDGTAPVQHSINLGETFKTSDLDELGMYYKSIRAVENDRQGKYDVNSLEKWMLGKGVKQDEINWLGIPDLVEELKSKGIKSIPRQELMDYLVANKLEIKKDVRGYNSSVDIDNDDAIEAAFDSYANARTNALSFLADMIYRGYNSNPLLLDEITHERTGEFLWDWNDDDSPSDTQIVNYLYELRASSFPMSEEERHRSLELQNEVLESSEAYNRAFNGEPLKSGIFSEYAEDFGDNKKTYREILYEIPRIQERSGDPWIYEAHWGGTPNVVAHARMQDTESMDGLPVRFIEEYQSDVHEQGREKGYKSNSIAEIERQVAKENDALDIYETFTRLNADATDAKKESDIAWEKNANGIITDEERDAINEKYYDANRKLYGFQGDNRSILNIIRDDAKQRNASAVPQAPFQKTWHEFLVNASLMDAINDDMDYLAWTTGEMQGRRYGIEIAKNIDTLEYSKEASTLFFYKDGRYVGSQVVHADELQNYVGKEVAEKLLEASNPSGIVNVGDDFQVGAQGMHNFYDIGGKSKQNIPAYLAKVGKRYGVQPEMLKLANGQEVPAIRITDEMKQTIPEQGFPMFSVNVDTQWANLGQQYGTYDNRRNRMRDANTPKQRTDVQQTSKFFDNYLQNAKLSDEMIGDAREAYVTDGVGTYTVTHLNDLVEEAKGELASEGYDFAMDRMLRDLDQQKVTPKLIVKGEQLLADALERNDRENAVKLTGKLCVISHEAGVSLNAFKALRQMGGVGQAAYITTLIDRLNNKTFADRIKRGKMQPLHLDQALFDDLVNAKTDAEVNNALEAIFIDVGGQIPPTLTDALKAWRYTAMLGNPVTHIRNMTGNTLMSGVAGVKDLIAAGIERGFVDQSEWTHAVYNPASDEHKAIRAYAKDSWAVHKAEVQGSGKQSFESRIMNYARTSNIDAVNAVEKFVSNALESEDAWSLKNAYVSAFTQYCIAQKLDPNNLSKEDEARAVDYATLEAQKRTFRDPSWIASWLSQTARTAAEHNFLAEILIEGVLPFKKTPVNILRRGIEYSPIGLVHGAFDALVNVKKGKVSAAQAVDEIASGLTGSMLFGLGMLLSRLGALRAHGDDDDDYEQFLEQTGDQQYALTLALGGQEFSLALSQLAPAAIPLFMGASLAEGVDSDTGMSILTTLANAANPMMEMSFLSSLNQALSSYNGYTDEGGLGALGAVATSIGKSYVSQYIPTLGGKIANIVDDTKRTSKGFKNSAVGNATWDSYFRGLERKVPGLENTLEESVDVLGRTKQKTTFTDWLLSVANNLVLPANVNVINRDEVDNALIDVFEMTGNEKILPTAPKKYIESGSGQNKQRYDLTASEYTEYSKQYGQAVYSAIKAVMADPKYLKSESWDEKAEMLKKAVENAETTIRNIWKEEKLSNAPRSSGIVFNPATGGASVAP